MATLHRTIVQAEVAPAYEERRGRVFIRVYATLAILATALFVALLFLVRSADILRWIDVPITRALQSIRLPAAAWLLTHMSDLGFFPLNIVSYVAVGIALLALRLRLEATVGIAASLLAGLLGGVIKSAVGRLRPSGPLIQVAAHLHDYSFPSGHVLQYTTLFGFTFFVVWIVWRPSLPRTVVLGILLLLVVLVGPSRVYLGEHWPTDVVGAYCLASLWLAGTIEVLLVLKTRLSPWWQGRPHRRRWTARWPR
jgi:membrane-associated phospholipid phosphatase